MQDRYLSAYYFMSTELCINRAHTRADMLWLAAHHFDAIHIAFHEEHNPESMSIHLIIEEAHRAGLKVFAIPSRWCGLIAGWPVLAGHFAATRPDVWMLREDGSYIFKNFCGPLCSVHHPDVVEHMIATTEKMVTHFDFDGITWDELKTLHETDYHPIAIEKFGGPVSGEPQVQASLDIFAACNRKAREIKPEIQIVSFIYADMAQEIVTMWAGTEGFDEIGPDGHVAHVGDPGVHHTKLLNPNAPRFVGLAKSLGKRSFALIETQGMDAPLAETTLKRMPEFLSQGVDHIAVYYHPLVKEEAAQITEEMGMILRDWRLG